MRIFLQFLGTLKCLWNVSLFERKTKRKIHTISTCHCCYYFLVWPRMNPTSCESVLKAVLIFAHGLKSYKYSNTISFKEAKIRCINFEAELKSHGQTNINRST